MAGAQRARQPKGISTGGQFVTEQRGEPTVQLTAPAPAAQGSCPYWVMDPEAGPAGFPRRMRGGVFTGHQCSECEHLGSTTRNGKTTASFITEAKSAHGTAYDYSRAVYRRNDDPVQILCPTHGPFWQTPNNHLKGRGCPRCRASKGERAVRAALTGAGVAFVEQWTHPGLRQDRPLKVDFCLPEHKVLVEFDGEFHRTAVRWPGQSQDDADQALARVQERDQIKDDWARANGYRMIRLTDPATVREELATAGLTRRA